MLALGEDLPKFSFFFHEQPSSVSRSVSSNPAAAAYPAGCPSGNKVKKISFRSSDFDPTTNTFLRPFTFRPRSCCNKN